MTSQGDVPTHSQDCDYDNYVMSWSSLTPTQGMAPSHGPDYSSAWNNSPASLGRAFNAGYDMVSPWGGRMPNIGEAFIQGTLFSQHATPYPVTGPSFPRLIAPIPGPRMDVRAVVTTRALLPGLVWQIPLVWALVTLVRLTLTCPQSHGSRRQVLLCVPPLDLACWAFLL